ncbi:glycoside hydrolase family 17 protein [Xanthobacter pseudotagetidis]|uniref:glycoside hydrolase family 17 protein n=1 Tax=Xanthobacter pseudotagetidis TaxID=3119911 RepID=UPI00372ABA6E
MSLRMPIASALVVSALVAALWAFVGQKVEMPPSPLAAGEKLPCVSYAPFRDGQSPFDRPLAIPEAQIDEDFARLSKLTGCVRTYSIEAGLDKAPALARKHGLDLLMGVWLSADPERNRQELEESIRIANENRDVIKALVVGNEVLLRGEMSPMELSDTLKYVRSKVAPIPVTYADVWEFWERNKGLSADVDFVTIHILPYWEDLPVSAAEAGPHVAQIRNEMADAFPGKELLIGETGWPSAGRMREEALPSPANQALVLHDLLAMAKRQNYRVNFIEAFDQPWKRRSEGTVGGHWGLLDAYARAPKFTWGAPVSNFPFWPVNILIGVLVVAAAHGAAFVGTRHAERAAPMGPLDWAVVGALALASGATLGQAAANLPLESLGLFGWLRNGAFFALALACALALPWLVGRGQGLVPVSHLLDPARRERGRAPAVVAALVLAATVTAVGVAALELVFNPRYKDFPDFVLTGPALGILVLALLLRPARTGLSATEQIARYAFLAAAIYIPLNETLSNWQALWFGGLCLAVALTVWRVQAVQRTA